MKWTVEYSCIQKCFHIDVYEKTLKRNIKNCLNENDQNNYIFLGMFNDIEAANVFVKKMKKTKKFLQEIKN